MLVNVVKIIQDTPTHNITLDQKEQIENVRINYHRIKTADIYKENEMPFELWPQEQTERTHRVPSRSSSSYQGLKLLMLG